jgi:hypothetical protein
MNKFLTSLIGIIVFISIMSLLSKFFDINPLYYVAFMLWIIALFVFNMFLDKERNNFFMQDIRNV